MISFDISLPDKKITTQLQQAIDFKTKPIGSLGRLEELALQIGIIQQSLKPALINPHLIVFAGDHGITEEGVSLYPSEVTRQMVHNFLTGGAAINVFTKQQDIQLKIVDAGVKSSFDNYDSSFINQKVRPGTRNLLESDAMSKGELATCLELGSRIVEQTHQQGCNIIGFGEMGIGNTSAASLIMSRLLDLSIRECVGKGTGLTNEGLEKKILILEKVLEKHGSVSTPLEVLQTFGGYEIAQMVSAMVKAAQLGMIILVDGFIASAAFLVAFRMSPSIMDYSIFSHQSNERGHAKLLEKVGANPLLNLGMRLGEGTGCAIAYPIIDSAVRFLNEMASFQEAGVSEGVDKTNQNA